MYGPENGREAARDALAYAWEHLARVSGMENPVGYLFRVGQSASRKYGRRHVVFPDVPITDTPRVELDLPRALSQLTIRQRCALVLVHVNGMTEREAAEVMGISRSAVRTHARRGLSRLRTALEAVDEA